MLTTYDPGSKSFGHATMLVGGPAYILSDGTLIEDTSPGARALQAEVTEARERLKRELAAMDAGEPFDFFFVTGYKPGQIQDGHVYDHVGGRLWRRIK